jgi:hypothetical protein
VRPKRALLGLIEAAIHQQLAKPNLNDLGPRRGGWQHVDPRPSPRGALLGATQLDHRGGRSLAEVSQRGDDARRLSLRSIAEIDERDPQVLLGNRAQRGIGERLPSPSADLALCCAWQIQSDE